MATLQTRLFELIYVIATDIKLLSSGKADKTDLALKADRATTIAYFVPWNGSPPANALPTDIIAFEDQGTTPLSTATPTLIGYAPFSTSATNVTFFLPAGGKAGDTVYFPHVFSPGSYTTYQFPGNGFVGMESNNISTDRRFEISKKVLTADDITAGKFTYSFTTTQKPSGAALLIRNAASEILPTTTKITTGLTTCQPPAVTTTKPALIFTFVATRMTGAASSATAPTGWIQLLKGDGTASFVSSGTTSGGETNLGAATIGTAPGGTIQAPGTYTPGPWTLPAATSTGFASTLAIQGA